MDDPQTTAHDRLRERLAELHAGMLGRMIARGAVEPGHLPLLAGINAALDSLPIEAETAARAVVSDDGREIRLALYNEAGAVAAVVLSPVHAVALAGGLIEAASSRWRS
jgi:hypothetical protein